MNKNVQELIEELRREMVKLVTQKGSFADKDVLLISQKLDTLLFQYQQDK